MEISESGLSLLEARTHASQIKPDMVRCCPTMDLIAYVTVDERVDIFRFGGQRAFTLQRKEPDLRVSSICWKYNGQYLAVGWSDGLVDVLSSETGSPLQMFRQVTTSIQDGGSAKSDPVTCVGWGLSLVDPATAKKTWSSSRGDSTTNIGINGSQKVNIKLDDLLDREPDIEAIGIPAELADQLAQLDVTDYMPKLPPLSMPTTTSRHGQAHLAELFSSQTLLDAALHQGSSKELHALNAFLMSSSDGPMRIVVYDSLSIGNISMPVPAGVQVQHLRHSSHPLAHCHNILSEYSNQSNCKLVLTPISFRFLKSAGKNVHFIDFKTAQLELLVQYVGEAITAIIHHWKHATDLPSRFQQNVNDSLSEKKEPNLPQSLFQLATTGYCTATMKEWLTDELAERGHKRWDHSINQGYTKILELLQENLLPALDRCTAILTNLQGLAQYHEHSTAFDVPLSSFSLLLDIIRCIRLISHHMILLASQEYHHFLAFSRWLRHSITVQGADPTTAAGEDAIEKDPGIDYLAVITYIQNAMEESSIAKYISEPGGDMGLKANPNIYDDLKEALKVTTTKAPHYEDKLKLSSYYSEWKGHNRILVEQITSWQRKTTVCAGGIVLSEGKSRALDMRMLWKPTTQSFISTYVLVTPETKPSTLTIYHLIHSELFDNVSDNVACETVTVNIPGRIIDSKFVNDKELFILFDTGYKIHLMSLQYANSVDAPTKLPYKRTSLGASVLPNDSAPEVDTQWSFSMERDLDSLYHTFSHDRDSFVPVRMELNGRRSRRTCVIIGEDKKQVRIYDLGTKNTAGGAL